MKRRRTDQEEVRFRTCSKAPQMLLMRSEGMPMPVSATCGRNGSVSEACVATVARCACNAVR